MSPLFTEGLMNNNNLIIMRLRSFRPSVIRFQAKVGETMKMEKVSGMLVGKGLSWGLIGGEVKGKGETQKHDFRPGKRYTFIILKTFARGRYGRQRVLVVVVVVVAVVVVVIIFYCLLVL